jgi:hypothetical protein
LAGESIIVMKDRVDFAITQRVNRLRIDEFNVYVQTFGAKKNPARSPQLRESRNS